MCTVLGCPTCACPEQFLLLWVNVETRRVCDVVLLCCGYVLYQGGVPHPVSSPCVILSSNHLGNLGTVVWSAVSLREGEIKKNYPPPVPPLSPHSPSETA